MVEVSVAAEALTAAAAIAAAEVSAAEQAAFQALREWSQTCQLIVAAGAHPPSLPSAADSLPPASFLATVRPSYPLVPPVVLTDPTMMGAQASMRSLHLAEAAKDRQLASVRPEATYRLLAGSSFLVAAVALVRAVAAVPSHPPRRRVRVVGASYLDLDLV